MPVFADQKFGAGGFGVAGDGVVQSLQGDGGAEFVFHAVGGDLELHRADGGEDRGLVAAPFGAQNLDDAFLFELVHAAAKPLVAAVVLGRDIGKCSRIAD